MLHQDRNALADVVKISPHIPSTGTQNAILSLIIIHVISSSQIYVAIDNPSLLRSVSCFTTSRFLWHCVRAAEYVSHAANLRRKRCQWLFHFSRFRDGIQDTQVFKYSGERLS